MSAGRPTETIEDTTISGYTLDCIEYLQSCLDTHERGEDILSDPFYTPRTPLTDELVDTLIAALDEEFDKEVKSFPAYHIRRSGADTTTDWHRLERHNRWALAEGLMRILEDHEDYAKQQQLAWTGAGGAPRDTEGPVTGPDYSGC